MNETDIIWVHPFARSLRYVREQTIRGPLPIGPKGSVVVAHSAPTLGIIRLWYLMPTDCDGVPPRDGGGRCVDPSSLRPNKPSSNWDSLKLPQNKPHPLGYRRWIHRASARAWDQIRDRKRKRWQSWRRALTLFWRGIKRAYLSFRGLRR